MSPLLGAHMSVAGGLPNAADRAVVHGCQAFQIFAKNANQWRGRDVPPQEVRDFREKTAAAGIGSVVSHASYLINLAATDAVLRRRSIDAMGDEIDRAEALGLLGVVLHPGCYTQGSEQPGLDLIAAALAELLAARAQGQTMVLLEQTAGQGTALGRTFEQLASILKSAGHHPRIGVCLDTCHLLAAGYDVCSAEGYENTVAQFERLIGFQRLKVWHLNDSKRPLGSRVDRHEHIGKGYLGLPFFRRLVNDVRFLHLPMLLETPKTEGRSPNRIEVDPLDARNLKTLRSLLSETRRVERQRAEPQRAQRAQRARRR